MDITVKPNADNESFVQQLQQLEWVSYDMSKRIVYEGAGVVADAVKAATPEDTSDLKESLGITQIKVFSDVTETDVGFHDYDRKGVPNLLKARAIETGTSDGRIKRRPFFRPTVKAAKAKAIHAMAAEADACIEKITNK